MEKININETFREHFMMQTQGYKNQTPIILIFIRVLICVQFGR